MRPMRVIGLVLLALVLLILIATPIGPALLNLIGAIFVLIWRILARLVSDI